MGSGIDKNTSYKLWLIFGFITVFIIALLVFQVTTFIDTKNQRENIEALRKAQLKFINSTKSEELKADSLKAKQKPE